MYQMQLLKWTKNHPTDTKHFLLQRITQICSTHRNHTPKITEDFKRESTKKMKKRRSQKSVILETKIRKVSRATIKCLIYNTHHDHWFPLRDQWPRATHVAQGIGLGFWVSSIMLSGNGNIIPSYGLSPISS